MLGGLVAASLLWLVLVDGRPPLEEQPPREPFVLGPGATEGVVPSGPVTTLGSPFRWTLDLQGWFVVVVFSDPEGGVEATELAQSPRLEENEWTWPAEQVDTWPDRIRWEVRSFDASGVLQESVTVRAWRYDASKESSGS